MKMKLQKGVRLIELLPEQDKMKFFCAKVNGKIKELNFAPDNDMEADVNFLALNDSDATRIYNTSLRYLISMAVKLINPKLDCRIFYNVSRSFFVRVINNKDNKTDVKMVKKIEAKMRELVAMNLPFERIKIPKEEAMKIYRENNYADKIRVLKYRSESFVHLYKTVIDGKAYYDYLYGHLVPSTGYLDKFVLRYYAPGFVCQGPRAEFKGSIPEFYDEIKFANALQSTSHWAENNKLDTVVHINQFIKNYGQMALINLCEARINNMLSDLGKAITESEYAYRLICVAGPSSSGKTSFANRLMFELMSRNKRPIRISLDNFYIPKGVLPEGTDIESIEALDVDYFNDCMTKLIAGESVALPIYDFKSGMRAFSKPISLEDNEPIIIEGIHALNDKMTKSIPDYQKYKIYIAPQPQVNIDNHTPISMTDMRLLRRIARDARTRGSDASDTIAMWPNVRAGEFKYIYPTQENADFVFDSFLPYELCALRNIVIPQLENIKPDADEYITATRLKTMVKYFLPIGTADIPCNSLIREFVGGSSFKDAR